MAKIIFKNIAEVKVVFIVQLNVEIIVVVK